MQLQLRAGVVMKLKTSFRGELLLLSAVVNLVSFMNYSSRNKILKLERLVIETTSYLLGQE